MPFRHEFEREFHEDAENIITDVEIREDESWNSFNLKLNALCCYHNQVIERKFRTTIIEELGIQDIEIPKDDDPDFMGGITGEEKKIGKRLLGLVPYFGAEKTRELVSSLRERNRYREMIRNKFSLKEKSIQNEKEGELFLKLSGCVDNGVIRIGEIPKWNDEIDRFNFYSRDKGEVIGQAEREMCMREFINVKLYLDIKNMIIREFAFSNGLSKEEAIQLLPEKQHEVSLIYDYCVKVGWIHN